MSIRKNCISVIAAMALLTSTSVVVAGNFSCVVEVMKSTCWQNRNLHLTLNMFDAASLKVINSYSMDGKTNYIQKTFACDAASGIGMSALMSPPVWPKDKDKWYRSQKLYAIPATLEKNAKQWVLQLCFGKDFSSVPLSVDGKVTDCKCEFPQNKALKPIKH